MDVGLGKLVVLPACRGIAIGIAQPDERGGKSTMAQC